MTTARRHFVTLGMFIVDQFSFLDEDGRPTGRTLPDQIGGGGTYASIGARIWLPPAKLGMIVDRGHDFPEEIQQRLDSYGKEMWLYRDDASRVTTKAINEYKGEFRGFEYLTPRIRITPNDLLGTQLERSATLHFICSPTRAAVIMSEVKAVEGWSPITIYEPIPYRCVPAQLPALIEILPSISILSPNADEALALLSISGAPTKELIERACLQFLEYGVGQNGTGTVIIRSGHLGAFVASRALQGQWIPAYWGPQDVARVVDVTGAGNAFLGGLSAGLLLAAGNIMEAVLYATISAAFIIEQEGLPNFSHHSNGTELWNAELPTQRLENLRLRLKKIA